MAAESVRIERVKLKDLPALATSSVDSATPGTFIPITKHRALAMTHNPFADPDDVAMLLAKEGDRSVGYFGVMPVMLQHEGKLHKVHWLTTWAVAPEFLGKGLGSKLMEAALDMNVDLAIVGSKPARRVSSKYGFHELKPLHYVQIDFRVAGSYNPLSLLLRLFRKLASLVRLRLPIESLDRTLSKIFELFFGWLIRPILYSLAFHRISHELKSVTIKQVLRVEPPRVEAADKDRTGFYRDSRVVNWMLANPWALPSGESESEKLNYGFTDSRPGFKLIAWQLYSATEENLGYICFQVSRLRGQVVVKVLDSDLTPRSPNSLLALALRFAKDQHASVIEGANELAKPLTDFLGSLLIIHRQRTSQVHPHSEDSPMAQAWQQIEQTYCDGDMAFT